MSVSQGKNRSVQSVLLDKSTMRARTEDTLKGSLKTIGGLHNDLFGLRGSRVELAQN